MAGVSGMVDGRPSATEGAPPRTWTFTAPRARGELSRMLGESDATTSISVTIRRVEDVAVVDVDREVVARVPCADWWIWLCMKAARADFTRGSVRMCRNDMGFWFMIEGCVAPTIVNEAAIDSLVNVLGGVRGG